MFGAVAALGVVLERLGGVLESLGGVLQPSWRRLGAYERRLEGVLKLRRALPQAIRPLEIIRAPWRPLRAP